MRLLLDTHTFLWWCSDDARLSLAAIDAVGSAENEVWLSVVSAWEIAIKAGLKKLDLGGPAATFLPRELATNRFDVLGIELRGETGSGSAGEQPDNG